MCNLNNQAIVKISKVTTGFDFSIYCKFQQVNSQWLGYAVNAAWKVI